MDGVALASKHGAVAGVDVFAFVRSVASRKTARQETWAVPRCARDRRL
jgi:hypothetical protein